MQTLLQIGEAISITDKFGTYSALQWGFLIVIVLLLIVSSYLVYTLTKQDKTRDLWRKEREAEINQTQLTVAKMRLEIDALKKQNDEIIKDYKALSAHLGTMNDDLNKSLGKISNDVSFLRGRLDQPLLPPG